MYFGRNWHLAPTLFDIQFTNHNDVDSKYSCEVSHMEYLQDNFMLVRMYISYKYYHIMHLLKPLNGHNIFHRYLLCFVLLLLYNFDFP